MAVIALITLGCGGSESSSSADASVDATSTSDTALSPDSRIDPTSKCYFTGDWIVDGATRGMRADGCPIGSTNAGVVLFGMTAQQGSERMQLQFYLDEPIAPGYTGPIRVKDVKAYIYATSSASKWVGTTCTLSITRNEVDMPAMDAGADAGTTFHFRAWASGSCSAPFTPEGTTSTLSLGAYELMFDATR